MHYHLIHAQKKTIFMSDIANRFSSFLAKIAVTFWINQEFTMKLFCFLRCNLHTWNNNSDDSRIEFPTWSPYDPPTYCINVFLVTCKRLYKDAMLVHRSVHLTIGWSFTSIFDRVFCCFEASRNSLLPLLNCTQLR